MPVVTGEPTQLPSKLPAVLVGPLVFQLSLTANTADVMRVMASSGNQHSAPWWNFVYAPTFLRGISGVINANAVPAANTLTLTPSAAVSAFNGTESPANITGTSYTAAGGATGRFSLTYASPVALPYTKGSHLVISMGIVATGAGAVDVQAYLHLEP